MNKKNVALIAGGNLVVIALVVWLLWPAAQSVPTAPPAVVISSPAPMHTPDAAPNTTVNVADLAAKIDPVCDMHLEEHGVSATALYEGKTYGFCSAYCKGEFEKEPAKYLAKLAELAKKDVASALTTQP